jgi:MinD-like ATPase involved in chromosome partitioning or flagellar assembly
MPIVAVAGDACTTTTVALAAAWPADDDVLVIEADPTGGDLAAWFDLPVVPSLSTVVTRLADGAWPEIERHTRLADNGIRLVPAPLHAAEAAGAIDEAARMVVPTLATLRTPITIADTGRLGTSPATHPFIAAASVVVVVHRQSTQSSRAAGARLQRLVEMLERLASSPMSTVVAVVGARPFGIEEVESFVQDAVGHTPVVGLPLDELAAGVFGGRTGVSARRLARLPLLRAARDLAITVDGTLSTSSAGLWKAAR